MAKGTVPKPRDTQKENQVARQLFKQFENLSSEVRDLLITHASSAHALTHVAGGIQHTLDELRGSASALELRQTATQIRAQTAHGAQLLFRLEAVAGQLEGLAWARDALEQAEYFANG